MVTHKAEVEEVDKEQYLTLHINSIDFRIPLTKDEPNDVKSVFNSLLLELKKGLIEFEVDEVEDGDIYHHVAKEYITQLNLELGQVYDELVENELVEEEG